MKKTFIFYTDWIDYTKEMNREEKGLFLETILAYQNSEKLPDDIQPIKFIWSRIQKQLDKDNQKWSDELEKRKEAGKLGGLANASKIKQMLASASNGKQIIADNVNDNVNNNNYKELEQISEITNKHKKSLSKDFTEELKEYSKLYLEDKNNLSSYLLYVFFDLGYIPAKGETVEDFKNRFKKMIVEGKNIKDRFLLKNIIDNFYNYWKYDSKKQVSRFKTTFLNSPLFNNKK